MATATLAKNVRLGKLRDPRHGQQRLAGYGPIQDRRCAMKTLSSSSQMVIISMQMAIALAIVLFACAAVAEGQPPGAPPRAAVRARTLHNVQPYYPSTPLYAVPRPLFRGWPTVHHASTAAESYARGQAAMTYAQGHYNLLTAEARVVHTEAQRREIENREQWINSYFATREKNRQERAAERGPRPTVEQLRRIAAAGKPAPPSPSEVDAVTGEIAWPPLLQGEEYGPFRAELESVFAQRATTGQVGTDALGKARHAADSMLDELKTHVRKVPQQDYIAARRFIESLAYAAQQPPG
jgi:hypothetical protein